jgi:DNA gyrase subunit A
MKLNRVMIVTHCQSFKAISRIAVKELPISGRATQGVKLINIKSGDSIADVSLIVDGQLEEPEIDESNTEA